MDVFVRNVPGGATNKELEKFFRGPLKRCNIDVFRVEKLGKNPYALITILDVQLGESFLRLYGNNTKTSRTCRAHPLSWAGQNLQCSKSRNPPSDFAVRALKSEAARRAAEPDKLKAPEKDARTNRRFHVHSLQCGVWTYGSGTSSAYPKRGQLCFSPYFVKREDGHITLGRKMVVVILGSQSVDRYRIDINYEDCRYIALGTSEDPTISFDLRFAPHMYKIPAELQIWDLMQGMSLANPVLKSTQQKKIRLPALDSVHSKVAGSCLVYRFSLAGGAMLDDVHKILRMNVRSCSVRAMAIPPQHPSEDLDTSLVRLNHQLTDTGRFGTMPFSLRYQLSRLAWNGILLPIQVFKLLPSVAALQQSYGLDATLSALRRFAREVEAPGPDTAEESVSMTALETMLDTYAADYDEVAPNNPYVLAKRYDHVGLVHKILVTPASIRLEGPEPETMNRVLRHYSDHSDHFIRVVFQDEDGGSLRYDHRTSLEVIYHQRFKNFLDKQVVIVGKAFSFLGFSHSSLRAQSCWFMAPMFREMGLVFADNVLKELGDFSHIQTPAKCAARIGQNFSDTNATVDLDERMVMDLPLVTRNGRDFGDGVGTISLELLELVWQRYGSRRLVKPTALQIRFQGFKGMVALDSRLQGRCLKLRSNMKKYESSATWNLEICGAAFRPLPMILNRQFIKIFEDLGIPTQVFMELQANATSLLHRMTASHINTKVFLRTVEGAQAAQLPSLIQHLGDIGLDYRTDDFLYRAVEIAVVAKLQDIKYRGRIPVDKGVTLYGIMDETGFLNEGEIFVITQDARGGARQVLVQDRVVVTRSPAMHPGDIQVARAVDAPHSSPLILLSNVVVFSQYGDRDLPSQLSGGDLDGDLYNVIWDPALVPKELYVAADYPRVEAVSLGRPVTRKDMSDFFVNFMESDQLGMICNMHLQLADQRELGTLDPECIFLAQMASTAVDFSKTGLPVDLSKLPRTERCKPDFMKPSPRVRVSPKEALGFVYDEQDDDEAFDGLDIEKRAVLYYESNKTLGCLFRAIDERKFVDNLQKERSTGTQSNTTESGLTARLLEYMMHWANQFGILFDHYVEAARNIRNSYEENLLDILHHCNPSRHFPLSEEEAFVGTILGRHGGMQGKPLRELSQAMRNRLKTVIDYTTLRIVKGDQIMNSANDLDDLYDDREFEALPRAIACLWIAVNELGYRDRQLGELKSFKYLAAGTCLRELERYRITTFGLYGMLPSISSGTDGTSWRYSERS